MDTDPQTLHAERFEEIARLIERDVDRLIAEWLASASAQQPDADPAYRAEMQDRLPAFLRALAASLRRSDSAESGPHRMLALEHGEQRWTAGWKLSEVVRDYQIMRLLLVDHLDEALDRPLLTREVMMIGLLLDEAIASAVVMFVAQQEQTLGQAEKRIREVMDTVADGIMTLDPKGHVMMLNPAAERIFDCPSDTLLGMDLRQLVTFPASDNLAQWQSLLSDGPETITVRKQAFGLRKGGARFELEMAITGFHRDDRKHWIVVVRDITEQKRLENELKRSALEQQQLNQSLASLSAEADASNRAKSEFLASMSHEIRTPMTAILGYVELLRGELHDPGQLHAVDTIQRNADFLLEIINDLLDLSKIEARKFDIESAAVSPSDVLAEVAALMAIRAELKGIRLVSEYRGAIPETIQTDAKRLKQILINLVGNAIKFTDQGEVRIIVSLAESQPPARIVFTVIDTGIGMSVGELPLVFQPFLQGQSAASRRVGGTGLGLTISRHLAELLGGHLEVESELGSGSTFRLVLPTGSFDGTRMVQRQPIERSEQSPAPKTSLPRLACRVLAADDRRDNQLLIEKILRKAGAHVAIAGNGRAAVEQVIQAAAAGEAFDVVLMDMQMPELDGYEATAQLRAAGYGVPIIALTASAMKGDHERCLQMGCNDYLPKPIDFTLLVEMVARYAGTSQRN